MPYRRSYKKGFIGPRRKPYKRKRKRKRQSFATRVRGVINTQNQNRRIVKSTDTTFGVESGTNQSLLWADAHCGGIAHMEEMMDTSVKAGDQAQVEGIINAGSYVSPAGVIYERPTGSQIHDATIDGNERYLCSFKNIHVSTLIKNAEIHPCDVTVYECVCKIDRTNASTGTNPVAALMDDLLNGLQAYDIGDSTGTYGSSAATAVVGDDLYGSDSGFIRTWDRTVHPNMSKLFKHNWKIAKSKNFRLQPGDEIRWRSKPKSYTFSPRVVYQIDSAENRSLVAGVTTVILVKMTGLLGRSSTAGEEDIVGFLKAELLQSFSRGASLLPRSSVVKGVHLASVKKDDLSLRTLHDVTEVEQKEEDAS